MDNFGEEIVAALGERVHGFLCGAEFATSGAEGAVVVG